MIHLTTHRSTLVSRQVYEGWRPESSSIDVAVPPTGRLAFVHWQATGRLAGRDRPIAQSGMTALVFDPKDNKIKETLGFR